MSPSKVYIGEPVPRVDGPLKTSGQARYAADHRPYPGTALHAVLVKSSVPSGRILSFALGPAAKMEGFVRFLSHEDGPLIRTIAHASDGAFAAGEGLTPFESDRVHFAGQHIGVVVAESLEAAEAAAEVISVQYAEEPAHCAFEHPEARTERPARYNTGEALQVNRGHVEAGLEAADASIVGHYRTPIEHHNPIEPSATLAFWEGNQLTVYDATQGNVNDQHYIAHGMGVEAERVRVLNPFIGGGFGCKGFAWPHSLVAAAASRAVGRPVKLVLRRSDMYTSCGYRPETKQEVVLAAKADGKLTAARHLTWSHRSPVGDHMEPCGSTTAMLYACRNLEIKHENRILNRPSATPMRAPGEASGSFALESAMDELAERLDLDPLELRRRNHSESDPRTGRKWSSEHLLECYARGAEKIGWGRRQSAGTWQEGHDRVGLGMATSCYPGYRMPSSTRVQLERDGQVIVSASVQDIGTGLYTVIAQMVSDRLGVPPERVQVQLGDTRLPPGPLAGGSMTTASVAGSVDDACRKLAAALRERFDPERTSANDEVTLAEGQIRVGRLTKPIESVLDVGSSGLAVEGVSDVTFGFSGGAERGKSFYSFGAIFAEVRVDRDFGVVRLPKMVGVFDVGRVINPQTARSQMIGGMTFGIGMALMEETFLDPQSGRFVNASLGEYYVPVNADVHEIEVEMLDVPDFEFNPFGARGIGEIGNVGAAAAIANAVYNATGVRVRSLPIRLDDLLQVSP